jgi:predicted permease
VTSGRDAVRRTRVVVEGLRDDLAFTIRALRRMPIFTATVVVTLAFGIGGNVATLSLIDRLLFRAPPGVADSKLVRRVYAQLSIAGDASYFSEHFSVPDFLALAAAVNQQADVEAFTTSRDLPLGDGRIRVTVGHVSAGFLSELGLHAARGRLFTAEENRIGDPRPVALMSHSLWTNAFGGDSAILGQTVTVDGTRVTIVGVLPRNFVGITLDPVDLWMPLAAAAMQGGEPSGWTRNAVFLELVARLRPGVQDAALEQRLTAIFRSAEPRRRRTARIVTAPLLAARGPVPLLPSVERNLSLAKHLYAVSSMVLLVAAVNVASLLLLRAVHRRREISIRIALGVSMRRLQAQLVIETLVLALGAGIAAALVGWWGSMLLSVRLLPAMEWGASALDPRVLAIALALALVAAFIAGLAPSRLVKRARLGEVLRLEGGSMDRTGSKLRGTLLVLQTALSVALISSAGAFLLSLHRVGRADLGFDPNQLIAVTLAGPADLGTAAVAAARLRALPFVESVANATADAFPGGQMTRFRPDEATSSVASMSSYNVVDANFFMVAGTKTIHGRVFTKRDDAAAEPVAVITAAAAREFWGDRDPIGRCGYVFGVCRRVVGVVSDVRGDLAEPAVAHFFLPLAQSGRVAGRVILARVRDNVTVAELAEVRRVLSSTLSARGGSRIARAGDRMDTQLKPLRAATALFGVFGVLTLMSMAAGIYGRVSYEVSLRFRELGVRVALGASGGSVVRLVMGAGLRQAAAGTALGLVIVVGTTGVTRRFLFDTSPLDPVVVMVVAFTVLVSAALATLAPASRAARLNPVDALRHE